ncbi:MAG: LPS export ABC transporter periplasmic protein LptC [Armatimonadetes bacterium]|nr:LPS export ABC transporter periplasmic protein LptC [Armatimonadota bacterium]
MIDSSPPPKPCRPPLVAPLRRGESSPLLNALAEGRLSILPAASPSGVPNPVPPLPPGSVGGPSGSPPPPGSALSAATEALPAAPAEPAPDDLVPDEADSDEAPPPLEPLPDLPPPPPDEEPVIPSPAPDSIPVEIAADESEGNTDEDQVILRGNARIRSEEREILADQITADTRTTEILAEGDVRVTGDGRRIEGQRARGNLRQRTVNLEGDVTYTSVLQIPNERVGPRDLPITVRAEAIDYNFEQRTGSVRNLETTLQGLRFRGESGVLLPDQRLQIQGAEFSFCPVDERGRYGYRLRAQQVDYNPLEGAVAQRATLYIGNRRIVTLSRYEIERGGEGGSANIPLPRIGSSRLAGSFVSFGFQPTLRRNVIADTRLELATKVGLRVFTTARSVSGGPNPFLRVHLDEEVLGRDPQRLLIDRLPEVGFLLDERSRSRWSRRLRGEVSYGYIRQHNPNRRTGRGLLSLLAQPIPLQDWGGWRLSARPGLNLMQYSSGESYRDLYGEFALARRWAPRRDVRVGITKHLTGGSTPFRFDEALIPTELFGRLRWTAGDWGFGLDSRYDLSRSELFDARFSIGKVIRCVEPRLVFSTRLRQVRLEVNLLGLTDLDDLPPAGTVPPPSVSYPPDQANGCDSCDRTAHLPR